MKRIYNIPRGAFCDHRRMKKVLCKSKPPCLCCVECPDCGLGWMLYEDVHGYYFAGIK